MRQQDEGCLIVLRATIAAAWLQEKKTFFDIVEILKYIAQLKEMKDQHLGGEDYPLGPLPHIALHFVLFNELSMNHPSDF